jgi:hypothetical protein
MQDVFGWLKVAFTSTFGSSFALFSVVVVAALIF